MIAPPPVQRLGSAVLIQGPALAELLQLAVLGAQSRRHRDGIESSAATREMLRTIGEAAGMTRPRHAEEPEPSSSSWMHRAVSTREAAQMLGLSRRQVQRIPIPILGARNVGGRLLLERAAVDTYREATQ